MGSLCIEVRRLGGGFDPPVPAHPASGLSGGTDSVEVIADGATRSADGRSILLGWAVRGLEEVHPGGPRPAGTYVLLHRDRSTVEVLSDFAGSRSVWWYLDDHRFLAATSQREIIRRLGNFEPDPEAPTWMMTNGSLGPQCRWDRRLRLLGPAGRLRLERGSWTLEVIEERVEFCAAAASEGQHQRNLMEALSSSLSDARFDGGGWVLPLSGGFDSRALLSLIPSTRKLPTLTWGTAAALQDPNSDAAVAARVAAALDTRHRYWTLDERSVEPDVSLANFISAGEGRIDHYSGYVDGLALWRQLREDGVRGIVRGDEGFGWLPAHTGRKARLTVGLGLPEDYRMLSNFVARGWLRPVHLPRGLHRERSETPAAYRDRLYHSVRIPTTLAALHDLKAPFVEIANPFLIEPVLRVVRRLPDHLRTEKLLFRRIADAHSPPIPYASESATLGLTEVLDRPGYRSLLLDRLDSRQARSVLDPALLHHLRSKIGQRAIRGSSPGWPRRLVKTVPAFARHRLEDLRSALDPPTAVLAFRALLICEAHRLFTEVGRP